MTMFSSSTVQPAMSGTSGGLVRWIGIGAHALATFWVRRAAIKALRELDDRALRDIGLHRSQIESAVGGAFNPDMGRMR
ncbi:DUF1127 domain-containing protein [Bradyrhizobium sediminis]|uniref:DUF1127 domain-containing protein n=1 Tax=Bradyrhizobium sediminis TaxID=2840469 RepID=A0A975NH05_9BRAD|nr:DUF1127 domain-containing protein [Bradyrhizobium sediminis]QWG14978.1 DUF1127 domain-containing protein [Bradyrhizobium sediminis]